MFQKKPPKDIFKAIERLLKIRPRSVGELRQRLLFKGFDPALVTDTLTVLESRGLLNDRAFATWWIRQRTSVKPMGAFGLSMELKAKRLGKETIERAIGESGVKESELELARAALEKRLPRYQKLDHLARRRKISGFLARRGFSTGTISAIIKSLEKK